jgi:thermostable 8-oxoguanine DNA glycosylase
VASLLTTQQRSGPDSPISNLLKIDPFPLEVATCDGRKDLTEYARSVLSEHGGIRFTERLPKFFALNLPLATGEKWVELSHHLETLRTHENLNEEREVANFIDDQFWGIGPKQARNLLQMLGLTRYVIPIDSRVLKWMNESGFPIPSSPGLLAYRDYFEFVEDGLNELCSRAGIHPCILDAAVFGSFDGLNGADWTEQNAIW